MASGNGPNSLERVRPGYGQKQMTRPQPGNTVKKERHMIELGEFKGNATITLKRGADDRFGFTFGVNKAKLILEHLEEIKRFYEAHHADRPQKPAAGVPQNEA
jgi:hypothetical protein